jgi:hypothetical protein
MKQTRRQELKTNELSVYLQQIVESARRNANYLIGGAVVVVVILTIGLLIRRSQQREMANAWTTYEELRRKDVTIEPALRERAMDLVAAHEMDEDLGPLVLQLGARMNYELSLTLTGEEQQDRRLELINEAKRLCDTMLERYGDQGDVTARAAMGLAAIEESLLTMGRGERERVRQLYQMVIDGKPNPFKPLAESQLASLDERLEPIQIVATRPASALLAETRPAPATQPVTTLPVGKIDSSFPTELKPFGFDLGPAAPTPAPDAESAPEAAPPEPEAEPGAEPESESTAPDATPAEPETESGGEDTPAATAPSP